MVCNSEGCTQPQEVEMVYRNNQDDEKFCMNCGSYKFKKKKNAVQLKKLSSYHS